MPVFTEYSTSSHDLRVLPSFAPPVPRLSPKFEQAGARERYELVIAGAGPAGLFLELLLARYGLSDPSRLCVDSKSTALKSGRADGLQPRTLEVLKSLGLSEEILTEGCHMWEVAFWNPSSGDAKGGSRGIERTSIELDVAVPARFPHEVTIHQGRIERIFEDDLRRYSTRGVQRSSRVTSVTIDEEGDPEFPVLAVIEGPSGLRNVRTKYLVGADRAHSLIRRSMDLQLEGETSDFIWGVVDFDFLAQAERVFKPYKIKPRRSDAVDWWAAYQIGHRVAKHFVKRDSKGVNRVFIVGDACHTHSPKAGQGMNVSMMDSYNLSWKLVHSINGLTRNSQGDVDKVFDTYEFERQTVAQQLIAFDKEFSSMFSGKIGTETDTDGLTHEKFLEVFSTGNGFTSGCGIEYPENLLVKKITTEGVIEGNDYLQGILRPGRRLLNVKVKRHADGARRDLQDGT